MITTHIGGSKPAVRSRKRIAVNHPFPTTLPTPPNFALDELRLFIDYVSPGDLKPPRRALRKHGDRNLKAIECSIREFGFLVPILIDHNGRILVGYGRWLAAANAGLTRVPVIEASHLSEEQIRLFTICDNKLASTSEWDLDALRTEFAELAELNLEVGLNLELSGFSTTEIDSLTITSAEVAEGNSHEDVLPIGNPVGVTRLGNLWELNAHKLICGSPLMGETYGQLLGNERAQMIFSDVPSNLSSKTISGSGQHQHDDLAMAAEEMAPPDSISFLATAFGHCTSFSAAGSIHFQCMDWRHMREMLDAGHGAYSELKALIIWKKHSAGIGSFYRSQHELIFVWKNGAGAHINNFGTGDTGRYRTDVWEYRGNSGFHQERGEEPASHASVKTWMIVADAIRDCSKRGGIILDPFGGSGTTLIAAERTGRKARLIGLDPRNCDVTIRRWQKLTGKQARLIKTGQTFDELEAECLARVGADAGDGGSIEDYSDGNTA